MGLAGAVCPREGLSRTPCLKSGASPMFSIAKPLQNVAQAAAQGQAGGASPQPQNWGLQKAHPQGSRRRCPAPGAGAAQWSHKELWFPEQAVSEGEGGCSWEGQGCGLDEVLPRGRPWLLPLIYPKPWHSLSSCPVSWQVWHHFLASTWLPGKRRARFCPVLSRPAGLWLRPGKVVKG